MLPSVKFAKVAVRTAAGPERTGALEEAVWRAGGTVTEEGAHVRCLRLPADRMEVLDAVVPLLPEARSGTGVVMVVEGLDAPGLPQSWAERIVPHGARMHRWKKFPGAKEPSGFLVRAFGTACADVDWAAWRKRLEMQVSLERSAGEAARLKEAVFETALAFRDGAADREALDAAVDGYRRAAGFAEEAPAEGFAP